MRSMPVMIRSPFGPYFRKTRSVLTGAAGPLALVQKLETLDVAFVLEDARDIGLDPGRGDVDARVFRAHGIAKAREHIRDRVCHISVP